MSKDDLQNEKVNTLLKNQGIYNGLIGVGILYLLILRKITTIACLPLCYTLFWWHYTEVSHQETSQFSSSKELWPSSW